MTRTVAALRIMQADPARIWTSASLSVPLDCGPSEARKILQYLARAGEVESAGLNYWRVKLPPTPEQIRASVLQLLSLNENLEYTDAAVVKALPELRLTPERAGETLRALVDAGEVVCVRDNWEWFACA